MIPGKRIRNPASFAAAVLCLLSLPAGGFVYARPNRILSGTPLTLNEAAPYWFRVLLVLGIAAAVAAWAAGKSPRSAALRAGIGLALTLGIAAAAGAAGKALTGGTGDFGRVSLGGGFWTALFGCYCYVYLAAMRMKPGTLSRSVFLLAAPAGILLLFVSGVLDDLSITREYFMRREFFLRELRRHLLLAGGATALGFLAGVPLGAVSYRRPRSERFLFFGVNLAQTVPTLSLLGLLILPLSLLRERHTFLADLGIGGTGWAPALIVLFFYALLPIAGNTLAGLKSVDRNSIEAARGMGMSGGQIFFKIELPLSLPVILSGVRTALTQSMGNAILAGLIGGGGMGAVIFLGLAQAAPDLVLLGALPVALCALAADRAMHHLSALAVPDGGRPGQ